MPQTGTAGQVGFNTDSQQSTLDLTSLDGSVIITPTPTGFDIQANQDLCELAASLPDNGLIIGG